MLPGAFCLRGPQTSATSEVIGLMNVVVLCGRLTRDPELRYTSNGTAVANAALAVDRDFQAQNGERQVDFVNIVVWQKSGEALAKHKHKGDLLLVEGRLQIRKYEDSDGNKRQATEVVCNRVKFLPDGRRNNSDAQEGAADSEGGSEFGGGDGWAPPHLDDVPF